ncbi:hypothetical protein T484DRAFT_1818604, partial [Baffinella frigidus]
SSAKGTNDRVVPLAHIAHLRTRLSHFFRDSSRLAEAHDMLVAAVAEWKLCPGKQGRAASASLEKGELLLEWGKLVDAEQASAPKLTALKEAIGEVEIASGAGSVEYGRALFLAAEAMRRSKKESEAVAYCARAFQVLDDALEPDVKQSSPLYARCSYTLGVLQELLGKPWEAETCYARSAAVFGRALGLHNPEHCQSQGGVK